jgi:hypothetical protein
MQRRDCAIFAETRFSTGRIAKAILQHNGTQHDSGKATTTATLVC